MKWFLNIEGTFQAETLIIDKRSNDYISGRSKLDVRRQTSAFRPPNSSLQYISNLFHFSYSTYT